jgi:hypothetical protein
MQTFRLITNTEGVDLKSLSYQEFCKPHSRSNQSLKRSLSPDGTSQTKLYHSQVRGMG